MVNEILYRTEHNLREPDYYRKLFSTPEGLKDLGWNPGEVGSPVFIIYPNGASYELIPNKNKDGFYGSYGIPHYQQTVDEVVEHIRKVLQFEKQAKCLTSDPRAIVSASYESGLQKVASDLGLKPRKL